MTDIHWSHPIQVFWEGREAQSSKQREKGTLDVGSRGAVTGGQHLGALAAAIADLFTSDERIPLEVKSNGRIRLPGYYRPTKDWDIVVTYQGILVAAIELKSQVGSFGNNFNNRTEEAIGNAIDLLRAYDAGLIGPIRPWLGFVMILEKTDESTNFSDPAATMFPTDTRFCHTSYLDRYRILFQRLRDDGIYNAAVVVATEKGKTDIDESVPGLSFANFAIEVTKRIDQIVEISKLGDR